jgi:hypothetical protein
MGKRQVYDIPKSKARPQNTAYIVSARKLLNLKFRRHPHESGDLIVKGLEITLSEGFAGMTKRGVFLLKLYTKQYSCCHINEGDYQEKTNCPVSYQTNVKSIMSYFHTRQYILFNMIKVKQKVEGQFRPTKRAFRFALLRSITDTVIKRN